MSAEEALTARLADLESDSFQLKLRNYYLERRVSKELGGERRGETALRGLLATAPETPPRRRTTRDYDDEKPSRRRSWRTTDVSETSVVRHERRLDGFSSSKSLIDRLRGGVSGAVARRPLNAVSPRRSPPSSFETRLSK